MSRYRQVMIVLFLALSTLTSVSLTGNVNRTMSLASPPSVIQTAPTGAYFDHLVVIMMENQGVGDICGGNPPPCNGANTPYESTLANTYGIGQQYLALINTSWPDYYGILGASIFGCPTNCYPGPGSVTATNLVDRFESAGISWKGYFESQPLNAGCATSDSAPYTYIHNGFVLFQDITTNSARCNNLVLANPSSCTVTDCPLINDLNSGSAPNFMWLTPNDCNDMRSSSKCANGCTSGGSTACVTAGDNYLKSLIPNILSSSTFQTGRSALFLTFDEGTGYCPINGSSENCVYAVWAGPAAKKAFSSPNLYNHYSLTKTIEANWNLASLTSNDANAASMSEFLAPVAQSPDFSISSSPTSISTSAGSAATSSIVLSSLNGFSGTITLTGVSSPSGPTLTLTPSTLTLSSGSSASSTLTAATQSSTSIGTYTLTVSGSSSSTLHTATVTLIVTGGPDFSITDNPTSLSISQGSSTISTITLSSLNNFSGTITLSTASSPSGPMTSLSSTSVNLSSGNSATSTLTISTQSSTPTGTYTVSLNGTSGAISHASTITLTVTGPPDYSLNSSPSTLTLSQGSSGTSKITLASFNGFGGTVTLSSNSSPSGPLASLSPTSVTLSSGGSGTSTLSVSTASSTPIGTYTITVTGSSGSLSHSTNLTLTVSAIGDFSMSANPSSLTMTRSSSATSVITLTSINGFSGTVTVSVTSSGPRLQSSLSSSSISLSPNGTGSSTLTERAGRKIALGTYMVTVTATSGSITHSISIIVTVQ